ncbi:helix-turn-helix domain-containing protein [Nonomuraea sp. NPDC059007]|uniref:ArsR/SmtB family transcription factor n=1 Tax=Nonomuraea sp. NPDC059007 TaxID=3346692 RepID=UPI0036B99014
MLRIHFTGDDLARTRLASTADPLWETVFSLHRLYGRRGRTFFADWLTQVAPRLSAEPLGGLRSLAPPRPYFPDFLTPGNGGTLDDGLDSLLSTPGTRVRDEVSRLPGRTGWARDLARADAQAMDEVAGALRSLHRITVAPYWAQVRNHVAADHARRLRAFHSGGVEAVLHSLRPIMRWQPPVLHVEYPVDRDLHLGGRGLLLIPSWFCWGTPVSLADPGLPPVLVYPVEHRGAWLLPSGDGADDAVSGLLGPTRAAVLRATRSARSTTQLARLLHISPSSASQHASVLRAAGLITSSREENSVMHTITELGESLLT